MNGFDAKQTGINITFLLKQLNVIFDFFLSKQSELNDTKFFELKLNQKVLLLKRIFQQKKNVMKRMTKIFFFEK